MGTLCGLLGDIFMPFMHIHAIHLVQLWAGASLSLIRIEDATQREGAGSDRNHLLCPLIYQTE